MKTPVSKLVLATIVLLASTRALAEPPPLPVLVLEPPPASQLVGNYRLLGMMETAAWLELRGDARFLWALSVGGLDAQVEGQWQVSGDSVELRADGADTVLEQVFRPSPVLPVAEWVAHMSADHPLQGDHGAHYLLRLLDYEGVGPSALWAEALFDDGEVVDWVDEWLLPEHSERWFVAEHRPGRVIDEVLVVNGERYSRAIPMRIGPGEVGDVMVYPVPEPAVDDGGVSFVMMVLDIAQDGRLLPGRLLNPGAAYVRD